MKILVFRWLESVMLLKIVANRRLDKVTAMHIAFIFLAILCVDAIHERYIENDRVQTGIHHKLETNELHRVFGTEDVSQVPDYQIVHPYTVDKHAKRGSHVRRSLHHSDPMYIHFNAFGKEFHLKITENKDLVPDTQVIEHYTEDGVQRYRGNPGRYSTGTIVSDDDSNVAFDHTSGLSGMLIQGDDIYMIAPVPRRLSTRKMTHDSHGAHIIYRRSALPDSHPVKDFNCGVTGGLRSLKNSLRRRRRRRRRSSNKDPEKTMELMIAADKNAILYHGKEYLHSYLLNQANIVAGIFKDPTLEYPVTIAITRVVLLDNDALVNATNMDNLLSKFRDWFVPNNPSNESDPLHVDNGALLTKGGCANGCGLAGLAYIGMCSRFGSQSVTDDKGLMSAITMAHEIGHNLGLGHDSGNGSCSDGVYLMSSGSVSGGKAFEWSKCSSTSLAALLRGKASVCLDDKPVTRALTNATFQHYGVVYDGTKQCQLAFGKGYHHCKQYQHVCSTLHCKNPNGPYCDRTTYPSAHGTFCSPNHWCIYGECVRDGTPLPSPVDGGWTEYGEYTKCNRACGGGLQWRERTCTNPVAQHGGKTCKGSSRAHYKTCNCAKKCPANTKTFREVQCTAYSAGFIPVIDYSKPCLLLCKSDSTPHYVGLVADGTPPYNKFDLVCIQGEIRKVGCDLMLESGAIPDRCGICGGDGSTCAPITFTDMKPYDWQAVYELGRIPVGALNMHFKELAPTSNFITVKVGESNNFAYHVPDWSKDVSFAGLKCRYEMRDFFFADDLKCSGVSNEVVRPQWANYYRGKSAGLRWTYFVAAEGNTSDPEYLVSNQWGACSKSCAGGVQTRSVACRRVDDQSAISIAYCKRLAEPAKSQPCNTHMCPPQWYISPWGECSLTCGNGKKHRNITCSQLHSDGKYYKVSNQSLCTAAKPSVSVVENCNSVMCPAEWILGKWSQCSTTCGEGIQTQEISCKRVNGDGKVTVARDLECRAAKPSTMGPCNIDNPCPQWVIKYTKCSKTCGGGYEYPEAECFLIGVKKNDSLCNNDTRPDVSKMSPKSCNTEACDSFEWKTKDGTCSVSCGNGLIPINVTCNSVKSHHVVSDELCAGQTKPSGTKPCNAGECPEIYEWKIIPGPCSVTCGSGVSVDQAACFKKRDGSKVDDLLCEASLKPAAGNSKACVLGACPERYYWNVTYSACSVSCEQGTKQPLVKCKRVSDNIVVDDSKCSSKKPTPETVKCNMGQCPVTYYWKQTWGPCDATCGKGTKTSHYKCYMESSNSEMADSYCKGKAKPPSSTAECTSICSWKPKYGQCLPYCGSGFKLINLQCQSENKTEAEIKNCAKSSVGSIPSESCTSKSCKEYAPEVTDIPKFYSVGCFKDNPNDRHLPVMLGNFRQKIDWKDMSKTVVSCARKATSYKYFAIQYYGECWGSNDKKYFLSGSTTTCFEGTGRELTNFVYSFGAPETTTTLPPLMPLGCFADSLDFPRPMPYLIDNFRSLLQTNSLNEALASTIIANCAKAASRRGFNIFGIQYFGECWSGPSANETFNDDGVSTSCQYKLGAAGSYYVYKFT